MTREVIDQLRNMINNSQAIVFFGGAGVSTASGIPDFRSATGLYNKRTNSQYPPETMLSRAFMLQHPHEFFDYHLNNLLAREAKPNPAHLALADLETRGKLKAIVTQNIDGLHQAAGSKRVIELHGNTWSFYCADCGQRFDLAYVDASPVLPPACDRCGGMVRPNVVLYGKPLETDVIQDAIDAISSADMLIVGGTSLVVYPAAGMIDYYRGHQLVLINRDPTPYDYRADLVIHGDIAAVLPQAVALPG